MSAIQGILLYFDPTCRSEIGKYSDPLKFEIVRYKMDAVFPKLHCKTHSGPDFECVLKIWTENIQISQAPEQCPIFDLFSCTRSVVMIGVRYSDDHCTCLLIAT